MSFNFREINPTESSEHSTSLQNAMETNMETVVDTECRGEIEEGDSAGLESKRVGYREKFRSRVKTVLRGVKDLELEAMMRGVAPVPVSPEEEVVCTPNKKQFAKKPVLVLCACTAFSLVWISLFCSHADWTEHFYSNSGPVVACGVLLLMMMFPCLSCLKRIPDSTVSQSLLLGVSNVAFNFLLGKLSLSLGWERIAIGLLSLLACLVGILVYCHLSRGAGYEWRSAVNASMLFMTLVDFCVYLLCPTLGIEIVCSWLVNLFIGTALAKRISSSVDIPLKQLKMKHSLYFSLFLCFEVNRLLFRLVRTAKNRLVRACRRSSSSELMRQSEEKAVTLRSFHLASLSTAGNKHHESDSI